MTCKLRRLKKGRCLQSTNILIQYGIPIITFKI